MAFTTWSALHTALLDALADAVASGNFVAGEMEYDSGGTRRRFKYRSLDELKQAIDMARTMAAAESGAFVGRTYAKAGGHG